MDRRQFTRAAIASFVTPMLARPAKAAVRAGGRHFAVATRVFLPAAKGAAEAFLRLFAQRTCYQLATSLTWTTNGTARVVTDSHSGARALCITWQSGAERTAELVEHLTTWERGSEPRGHLSFNDRRRYTASTPALPTDGLVRE